MSRYVIIDLEMCNVPTDNQKRYPDLKKEIIQLGAVLLDNTFKITDTFMCFVSPEIGVLDAYIKKLTGISEKDLKGAPCVEAVLRKFFEWLPCDAIPVSWSESDSSQIRKETDAKGIRLPSLESLLERWVDCQKTFSEKMGHSKNYRLSEALSIADIDFEDGAHDALVDAHNTALLFAKMEQEPVLRLSPYYISSAEDKPLTFTPFAELLSKYTFK